MDLPRSPRSPPGDRNRLGRKEAVSVTPALARASHPADHRRDAGLRPLAATHATSRRARPAKGRSLGGAGACVLHPTARLRLLQDRLGGLRRAERQLRARDHAQEPRHRERTGAVKGVALFLGNTPAVCRASYIDPRVFDRYLSGWTIAIGRLGDPSDIGHPSKRRPLEEAVLDLIEDERTPALEKVA